MPLAPINRTANYIQINQKEFTNTSQQQQKVQKKEVSGAAWMIQNVSMPVKSYCSSSPLLFITRWTHRLQPLGSHSQGRRWAETEFASLMQPTLGHKPTSRPIAG